MGVHAIMVDVRCGYRRGLQASILRRHHGLTGGRMSKVVAHITISLDGYGSGPNDGPENPLGIGGEELHEWMFGKRTERDAQLRDEFRKAGAHVMGRRMFDLGDVHWGTNPPYHAPVFILTHRPHEPIEREGGTTYTFVTDGIESALAQAKAAAGDKPVNLSGGAKTINQYLKAGLVDELRLHIAPRILGGGSRLFEGLEGGSVEFEKVGGDDTPAASHVVLRVKR
jgi:dihydrofolate reductase